MLKFTGRFLIFLGISVLIAFGVYWVVQRNPAALGLASLPGRVEGRRFADQNAQGFTPGANIPQNSFQGRGFGDGDRLDSRFGSGQGWFGILRSLGVIGLITLAVVGFQKIISFAFRERPVRAVS